MKKVKIILLSLFSIFLLNSCSVLYMIAATGCADSLKFFCPIAYPKQKSHSKSPYKIYDIADNGKIKEYLTEVSNRKKVKIKYKNEIIEVPNDFELLGINLKYFDRELFDIASSSIEYLGGEIEKSQYFYDSEKRIGIPVYIFESKYKNIEELFEKVSQSDEYMLKKENGEIKFCYSDYTKSKFNCDFHSVESIGDNIFIYYSSGVLGKDFIGEIIK